MGNNSSSIENTSVSVTTDASVTHDQMIQRLKKDGKWRQEYVKDYSLDSEKVQKWLDCYEPQERKFAKYLIENSLHIGWTEFKQNLLRINTEMIQKIKGKFYLFTPQNTKNSIFYFGSLIYENLIFPHSKIKNKCTTANEKTLGKIIPASRSEINILYSDDMSYSGSQLSQEIRIISGFHSPVFFKFLTSKPKSSKDIPIYCAGNKILRIYSIYTDPKFEKYNPKFTLKNFKLESMNDAILVFQNAGSPKYPSYQWIIFTRESDKNDKIKFQIVTSWYALKEFLEKNQSLEFKREKVLEEKVDVALQYITPVIYHMKPIKIYLGIPYFTTSSLKTIKAIETETAGIQIIFGNYEKLFTIGDLYQKLPLSVSGKQRFMYFLLTHFNYYSQQPLQDISDDYIYPDSDPKQIALVWFDHKLADPISTISVILGCGLVVPYTFRNKKLTITGPAKMLGSLLKNCQDPSQSIKSKRKDFLTKFYSSNPSQNGGYQDHNYSPKDGYACGNCPHPFYKDG